MTTVAIIAEYNPPHLGHAYLVKSIRDFFGADTCVVAIMSGNFVQRGDVAICDAYLRGKMALSLGVDLVLELPFPYCLGTAEKYATAGVEIANQLGCIDYLAFGSESGDLTLIEQVAEFTLSEAYASEIQQVYEDENARVQSFATLRCNIISRFVDGATEEFLKSPNNILAIAYLRALKQTNSSIRPWTTKRLGTYHNGTSDRENFASASYIRGFIFEQKFDEITLHTTQETQQQLIEAQNAGHLPARLHAVGPHLLLSLRNRVSSGAGPTADMDRSLWERVASILPRVGTYDELIFQVKAKHYTDAHIRRALLFAYFGITSADLDTAPAYTKLLAANSVGCSLLKNIKRVGQIPVLTKTADYRARLDGVALRQAEIGFFADSVFYQCLEKPQSAADVFKKTPFIGK